MLEQLWHERKEQIERALVKGHDPLPLTDVEDMLIDGEAQYWPWKDSSAVTTAYMRGSELIVTVFAAGGDLDELLELHDNHLVPWSQNHLGAHRMEIHGRPGWKKYLKDRGYKVARVVYVKEF
jgi:hypothetical protein